MAEAHWEHFEHGADIGVRGIAPSVAEAFAQAAYAMSAVICDPTKIAARDCVKVACSAPDYEFLLVDWLNAIVYEMATRRMLFTRFEVTLSGDQLSGVLWGESLDIAKHQPAVEVKGATYTELKVAQDEQGQWVAQCVVDV
jgi:SHS2 domain-containing protein